MGGRRTFVATAIAVMLASACATRASSAPPALPDLQFAQVPAASRSNYDGDRFSYMEAGRSDAPVILLLHGSGGNSMQWRQQFAGLSDQFRLIAWNAPGYFLSNKFAKDDPTCQDYAEAVHDFLAALKLDRVNVVGNSFGSRVAQCFAINHPEQVVKLAMTGTGVGLEEGAARDDSRIAAAQGRFAAGSYAFGARAEALFGPNASPAQIEEIRRVARATDPQAYVMSAKLGLAYGYSPAESAAKLTMPVLLIQGTADQVNPGDRNAAILAKLLKAGRLEWLDGVGHLPEVERPEVVNSLMRDFFRP